MKKFAGLALSALMSVSAVSMISSGALAADLPVAEPVAEVVPAWDVAFGVAGVTDYVFRGISNSSQNPAVQGYAELQTEWVYAGLWSSSVDFPTTKGLTDPSAEIDVYGGFRHTWDALTVDVGGLYYWYPGEKIPAGGEALDYWEIYAKPTYAIGNLSFGPTVYWTSDFVGTGANALYASAVAKYTFTLDTMPDLGFYVSGEFGKQWTKKTTKFGGADFNTPNYLTWNAGAGVTYKAMSLEVRYYDSNLSRSECAFFSGSTSWCGSRIVGKLAFDTSLNKLK